VKEGGHGLLAYVHVKRGRQAAAKRAASYAKAKLGLPKYSEANVLVVSRLVRDYLQEVGMRPSHIAAVAPLAVSLTFIPTHADIEAKQVYASQAAVEAREAHDATYYTKVPGKGPLGWLRSRVVYTGQPAA